MWRQDVATTWARLPLHRLRARAKTGRMAPISLAGKVAVVTGAASGIGRAIALSLAKAGANLYLHTRQNSAGLQETADTIRSLGRAVETRLADLADESTHESL